MKLPEAVLDSMAAHAAETYPDECCGLLVRSADGAVSVHRVRNVQNEMHEQDPERFPRTARIAYSGDPKELKIALDAADELGCSLAAFYHSHPDHEAYFSDEDLAQATPFGEPSYPDALQIVLSVYDRELRDVKAFGWSAETETFEDVAVERVGGVR